MDEKDGVNIFLSEGAGLDVIVREIEDSGGKVPRDAFGHVRLDEINPGKWFAKHFAKRLNAEKILIQKSGYFARSSKANESDLKLIFELADYAEQSGIDGRNGVIGWDENRNNKLSCIEFNRIKGGKPFDTSSKWYIKMMNEIKSI